MSMLLRHTWFLTTVFFTVIGFAIYGSSLTHPFTSWDDTLLITENPIVQTGGIASVRAAFTSYDPELYIPMTFLSYQINHAMCGTSPVCFHATDLALHIANSVMVALILSVLLKSRKFGISLGLLFLVHPLHTEAVAWASSRKDTLSAFFSLASVCSYLAARRFPVSRWLFLSFACALFLLALLSKVVAAMLPVIFLLLDIYEGRKDRKGALIEKIPFALLSAVFIVIALYGKSQGLVHTTLLQKVLMGTLSMTFYVWKFVIPTGLSVIYPFEGSISLFSWPFPLTFLLVVCSALVAFIYWKRFPWILLGVGWYALFLLPSFSNIAKGGEIYFASDRYAYLASIGLLFLLGFAVKEWVSRGDSLRRMQSMLGLFIVCCVFSAVLAMRQSTFWSSSIALYERVLSLYPTSSAALNNLGMELYYAGDAAAAAPYIDQAIAIKDDPRFRVNRGILRSALGNDAAAEEDFLSAIDTVPGFTDGEYQLGLLRQKRGQFIEAEKWYLAVLQKHPENKNALNNLGGVYLQQGKWKDAIDVLERSVKLYPSFAESRYNLAGAYEQSGDLVKAAESYVASLSLRPDDPDTLTGLARVHYENGDIDAAAKLLMRALSINSSNQSAIDLVLRMKRDGVAE